MTRSLAKVPSVELQTLEFVEIARSVGGSHAALIRHHGIRVLLEYEPVFPVHKLGTLNGVLAILDVYVPPRYQRRGWLTAYLKLCHLLVDEAVLIAVMRGPVREALMRGGFEEALPGFLMLRK